MSTSIVLRRRLATELREHRLAAGLTQKEVAAHLGAAVSKIVRIESAESTVSVGDLRALLQLYGVDPETRERLVDLGRSARKRGGWWSVYRDLLPGPYVALEAEALRLHDYEPSLIPGLLQTEDYARAVVMLRAPNAHQEEIDRRVEARMKRQRRLHAEPLLQLHAIIDQAALTRGTPEIMRAQLEHLVEMAQLPNVSIRIVPTQIGLYPAMGYPFVVIGFPPPDPDIVLLESRLGEQYLTDPQEVAMVVAEIDQLEACALPPEESVTLIRKFIRELISHGRAARMAEGE